MMNAILISLRFKWNPGSFRASFVSPSESLFTPACVRGHAFYTSSFTDGCRSSRTLLSRLRSLNGTDCSAVLALFSSIFANMAFPQLDNGCRQLCKYASGSTFLWPSLQVLESTLSSGQHSKFDIFQSPFHC